MLYLNRNKSDETKVCKIQNKLPVQHFNIVSVIFKRIHSIAVFILSFVVKQIVTWYNERSE